MTVSRPVLSMVSPHLGLDDGDDDCDCQMCVVCFADGHSLDFTL